MDITCVLAALFFFTGNLILLIVYAKENGRDHFDLTQYKDLNPDYIQEEWKFRVQHRAPYLAAGLINGLAWFCLAFPLLQLCWILSLRGTHRIGLHVTVAILTLCGSFTEWISRFLYIGSSMATQLLVKEFELDHWYSINSNDGIGWRVLEVTHIVTSGLIWFIDAFEWLALFCIMTLLHISIRNWRTLDTTESFGGCWNAVGLFIALLSLLDFVAEALRLDGFKTFGPIAFWYATVNRLILIPFWLIILGRSLPYAAMRLNDVSPQPEAAAVANGGGGGGASPGFTTEGVAS